MNHFNEVQQLVARGALFVVNHSGGKDSQAMLIELAQIVPAAQLHIVHAELPGSDWDGLRDQIERNSYGLPVDYCRAKKTFLEMVEGRHEKITAAGTGASPWPSPKYRQCTSDLKRGPIEKLVRQIAAKRGANLIVMCTGLRAQESAARSKATQFKRHESLSKAGREVYEWLPIHEMLIEEVWSTIARAGQTPHPAYAQGMSRLSCRFCIMATEHDIKTAARLSPDVFARYVALEQKTGKTMMMSRKSLAEIAGA